MSEHKRSQQDTELDNLRQKVEKYKEAEELRLLLANTPCKNTSETGKFHFLPTDVDLSANDEVYFLTLNFIIIVENAYLSHRYTSSP